MPTERENAVAALTALAATALGITVTAAVRSDIPTATLVRGTPQLLVAEGELTETETMLSPLTYGVTRRVQLRIAYTAATEALRDSGIDAALAAIGAAIIANRTLSGVVEFAEAEAPELEAAELDGAARVALLPVLLTYTTADLAAA